MLKQIFGAAVLVAAFVPAASYADDGVTPAEVIAKVREGAAYLAKEGEAGFPPSRRKDRPSSGRTHTSSSTIARLT